MKKLDIRRVCGALLAALLLTACLLPARSYAAQDADVIHIGSEAELAEPGRTLRAGHMVTGQNGGAGL